MIQKNSNQTKVVKIQLPPLKPRPCLKLMKTSQSNFYKPMNFKYTGGRCSSHTDSSSPSFLKQNLPYTNQNILLKQKLKLYESLNQRKEFFKEYLTINPDEDKLRQTINRLDLQEFEQDILMSKSPQQRSQSPNKQQEMQDEIEDLIVEQFPMNLQPLKMKQSDLSTQKSNKAISIHMSTYDSNASSQTPHFGKTLITQKRIFEQYNSPFKNQSTLDKKPPLIRRNFEEYNNRVIQRSEDIEKVIDNLMSQIINERSKKYTLVRASSQKSTNAIHSISSTFLSRQKPNNNPFHKKTQSFHNMMYRSGTGSGEQQTTATPNNFQRKNTKIILN